MQDHSGFRRRRTAALVGLGAMAFVLALASTASACVTFMGQMTVDGHDGDTTVVGTGNSHGYCSTGHPTTAAAGHLGDTITLTVSPGDCFDALAAGAGHKLPEGNYEVRYNNRHSYTYNGSTWTMIPNSGCFLDAVNGRTTTKLGDFQVDAAGNGTWSGTLGSLTPPLHSLPIGASNLCIGNPLGAPVSGGQPGMLAPFQLLLI